MAQPPLRRSPSAKVKRRHLRRAACGKRTQDRMEDLFDMGLDNMLDALEILDESIDEWKDEEDDDDD